MSKRRSSSSRWRCYFDKLERWQPAYVYKALASADPDHPVTVADSELIVLIGPNNAGKSRALRDIEIFLQEGAPGQVVRTLSAKRMGDAEAIRDWVFQTTPSHSNSRPGQNLRSLRGGGVLSVDEAVRTWDSENPLGQLAQLMVFRADAETRLQLASSKPSVDILDGEATEPLQRLISDHQAESRLSESTRQAFDSAIHVNRAGGSTVHLHLIEESSSPRRTATLASMRRPSMHSLPNRKRLPQTFCSRIATASTICQRRSAHYALWGFRSRPLRTSTYSATCGRRVKTRLVAPIEN